MPDDGSIGWYVHLPFCTTKCGYCDFYSLPTLPGLVDGLVKALGREMALRDPGRPVETIFVGGGTPTVLPADALRVILNEISRRTGPVVEFTVEANPSSTDELKLELLHELGVNRISFGAQSFNPAELAVLERLHDPQHIFESVDAARAVGFDHINLDLIYGIPGQSLASWRETLARAIEIGTEHLSCYSLMYEPGTSMTRMRADGRVTPCDESLEADMFELTIDELSAAGYEHYEISNFARPGRRCRANIIYWENREYLGIGPSAVSYLDGVRRKNAADVRRYVERLSSDAENSPKRRRESAAVSPDVHDEGLNVVIPILGQPVSSEDPCAMLIAEQEQLSPRGRAGETAVQMLRLTEGVNFARFRERTGFDAASLFADELTRLGELGLLVCDANGFRLTRRGMLVSNQVMQGFLLESITEEV